MSRTHASINDNNQEDPKKRTDKVYENFGRAVSLAQSIETSLVILLIAFGLIPNAGPHSTVEDFNLFMDKNYKSTMVKLINYLKGIVNIPIDFESSLEQIRDKRNFLVHSYFRERSLKFSSIKGCEEMIIELNLMRVLFFRIIVTLDDAEDTLNSNE